MVKRKLINRNGRYYINDERDILGISTETFISLLKDKEIFNDKVLEVIKYFYLEEGHLSTTKFIVEKYNFPKGQNFNGIICAAVKRIYNKLGEDVVVLQAEKDKPSYWCILFHGWHERGGKNNFVWQLREELVAAIEALDLFNDKVEISDINSENETLIYKEGRLVEKYTWKYERSAKIRDEFLKYFKAKNGKLFCEVCGFDFEKVYGTLGTGFIEVHHNKPISTYEEEHSVNIYRDLNCICANCHRMIHRIKGDIKTINQMKKIIKTQERSR